MAKREKINVSRLNRTQVEALVGEIALLTIQRDQNMAKMDEELQEVRKQYGESIATVSARIDAGVADLRAWADAHPEEFIGRKSIEMVHGTVGFRTGMPALKTVRGVTWDKVLEKLNAMGLVAYVRAKYEADKEKLLADREEAVGQLFGQIGVLVKQEETFFVEPKREPVPESASTAQEAI